MYDNTTGKDDTIDTIGSMIPIITITTSRVGLWIVLVPIVTKIRVGLILGDIPMVGVVTRSAGCAVGAEKSGPLTRLGGLGHSRPPATEHHSSSQPIVHSSSHHSTSDTLDTV